MYTALLIVGGGALYACALWLILMFLKGAQLCSGEDHPTDAGPR